MSESRYLEQAERLNATVVNYYSREAGRRDADLLTATALENAWREGYEARRLGGAGDPSEDERKKAFAIRWLEFHRIGEGLHHTFAAVRALLADRGITNDHRAVLLDKWLTRQWQRLSAEYFAYSDREKYEALLGEARAAGIDVPDSVATWRGTGWAG